MAKKKKSGGAKIDPNAWMVTFGDLITLLLTFFVLLLSMSSMEDAKLEAISDSLGGSIIDAVRTSDFTSNEIVLVKDVKVLRDFLELVNPKLYSADREVVKDKEYQLRASADKAAATSGLQPDASEVEGGGGADAEVRVSAVAGGMLVTLPEQITFASGSAALLPGFAGGAKRVLDALAATMRRYKLEATVMGHTDDRPVAGSEYPSNWELSCARAAAIVSLLQTSSGADPTLLAAAGYGDARPIADNASLEGRTRNRRVEVFLRPTTGSGLSRHTDIDIDYKALEPAAPDDIIEIPANGERMGDA
ncbi:OmpA family protein [bacterium]|nr:OmpA family protein [bacterium]